METLVYLLLAAVTVTYLQLTGEAIPVAKRTAQVSTNPFDLGVLDSCVIPTAQQLSNCSKYISHAVPGAFLSANVLTMKHKSILGAYNNAYDKEANYGEPSQAQACAEAVLAAECRREFPSCSMVNGTRVVQLLTSVDCMDFNGCQVPPSCGDNSTSPLATCYPTSEFTNSYVHCNTLNGWSSTYITKWIHYILQEAESNIEYFKELLSNPMAQEKCVPLYAELRCGSVGRCSEQGTRLELNATREVCIALFSCVDSTVRTILNQFINCSHYPSYTDKPSTPATPITQQPTQPTTKPTSPTGHTTSTSRHTTSTHSSEYPSVLFPQQPSRISAASLSISSSSFQTLLTMLFSLLVVIVHVSLL